MLSLNPARVIQVLVAHADLLAVVVTAAIALLLLCGVACCRCGAHDEDDCFKRRSS